MGMDIYGLDPKLVGERPIIDFEKATDEEKKQFFKDLDAWEESNPGYYFRANLWSWRPIHMLIEHVNEFYNLNIDTSRYGENSGAGLKTQEDCDKLADALEYVLERDENMEDEGDRVYLNLGMWVDEEGNFLKEDTSEELNKQYEIGTIMYTSVISNTGQIVRPAWSTSKDHLEEFINFLRHCGGFEIW